MKLTILPMCTILLCACTTQSRQNRFVGTWSLPGSNYLLRIYPDGRVAQWPSPPNGDTAWTRIDGDTLDFGYAAPLRNPRLARRGPLLVMQNNRKDAILNRVKVDLVPPGPTTR